MVSRYKSVVRYPETSRITDPELRNFLTELIRALEDRDQNIPNLPLSKNEVTVSVVGSTYNLSASSTLPETVEFLGTLALKMKESGILK